MYAAMRFGLLSVCLLVSFVGTAQSQDLQMTLDWEFVADTVMGGVSEGQVTWEDAGQIARLTGCVSLDNNGGFVQMAADFTEGRAVFDASRFDGIEIELRGNGEQYDIRLRTDALNRPWQSFRTEIVAPENWTTLRVPFGKFEKHRTDAAFDPARLRRVGILAIGREFDADISVRAFRFYAD